MKRGVVFLFLVALLIPFNSSQAAGKLDNLRKAINEGDVATVHSILKKGGGVDVRLNENGDTPLLLSAEKGDLEIAGLLLDRGADIEARNIDGNTPLLNSVHHNHLEMATLLLATGADIEGACY
jgi:ankyrin repeat protein